MPYNIRHMIFDLDGTLSDSKVGITTCIAKALKKIGANNIPKADDMQWCVGPPIENSFATILQDDRPAIIDQAVAAYHYYYHENNGDALDRPFAGVKAMLTRLADKGYTLYLATLKPQENAREVLCRYGFDGFFSGVFGFEQNAMSDTKKPMIAHILNQYHLQPDQVAMVGDRATDILGAKANQVMSVAVSYGCGTAEEFESVSPDVICTSPEQIVSTFCH